MAISFWCATCGQPLAADDPDAGRDVECVRCGTVVRVPRNPGSPEPDRDDAPADPPPRPAPGFAADEAGRARAGLRLVQTSFWLFLAAAAVVAVSLVLDSFAGLTTGTAAEAAMVGAVVVGGVLRVVGYTLCRRVGRVLDADGPLVWGIVGAVVFTAGLATVVSNGLATVNPFAVFGDVVTVCGLAAALLGLIGELVALAFVRQVLVETRDPSDVRVVLAYVLTLLATGAAVPYSYVGYAFIVLGVGGFRAAMFGNPAWLPFAPELAFYVVVIGTAAVVVTVTLVRQYSRILSRCRAGLAAATLADPKPEPAPL